MSIAILPELPADEWFLSDWLERMGNQNPGGPGAFTTQDSEANIVIQVEANKVRSAIAQILGWAWADDEFPWLLHREYVPIQHPRFPSLWADSISVSDQYPLATNDYEDGDGNPTAQAPGVAFPDYGPDTYGRYAYSYLTVHFKPIKNYRLYADYDSGWTDFEGKEWLRFFGRLGTDVRLDLIAAEGATDDSGMYFAEGNDGSPGANGPVPGPTGAAWPGAVFVRKQTTNFHMIWRQVPINYTCGETLLTENDIASFLMPSPLRLILALGSLNSVPFPGSGSPYFPGILMFTALKETIYQQPLRTDSEFGLMAADYEMTFEMFDPNRDPNAVKVLGSSPDPAGNPAIPVSYGNTQVSYGHDLFPNRQTRYWYLATSGTSGAGGTRGTYTGKKFYPHTDFHDMFRHISNPLFPLPTG